LTSVTSKDGSALRGVEKAQQLVRRMKSRNLYHLCGEVVVSSSKLPRGRCTAADVLAHVKPSRSSGGGRSSRPIREEDILVSSCSLSYAMKDKNPVDLTHFYNIHRPNDAFQIPADAVSLLVPKMFSEAIVRVFVREEEHVEAVTDAFNGFLDMVRVPATPIHRAAVSRLRRGNSEEGLRSSQSLF
jgi:deoxynucleoside triphosphate triphosphohydrolase SAMHD1